MNTYPTIYIDEAGNTGSNVLNCNQPYFVLSAVHFTDAELVQLQKYIMYDKELHFVEMKKSTKGRNTIKLGTVVKRIKPYNELIANVI